MTDALTRAACRAALLATCGKALCADGRTVSSLWVLTDDAAACMERFGREVAAQLGTRILDPANWKPENGAVVVWESVMAAALAAAQEPHACSRCGDPDGYGHVCPEASD